MQKVYAIGETVLDIIFKDDKVCDAKPGGAMLNSSVSLGRALVDISLMTEFTDDHVGNMINNFLIKNNVKRQNIYYHQDGKTSVAMAFLDENNDGSYVFYKDNPGKRLEIEMPGFLKNDILLFGSFYGIDPGVRDKLFNIISYAKECGCLIIYDPNFRKPHVHQLNKLLPYIRENIEIADIVRGSDEDFEIIFNASSIEEVRDIIGIDSPALIMTKSSSSVFLDTYSLKTQFPVENIKPVSTIGAGDNFNSGIIYGIVKNKIKPSDINNLSENTWEQIISYGISFATNVCLGYDNYISHEFAGKLN